MTSIRKTKKALRKYALNDLKRSRLKRKVYCQRINGTRVFDNGKHMIVLAYRTRDKVLNRVFNCEYFYSD